MSARQSSDGLASSHEKLKIEVSVRNDVFHLRYTQQQDTGNRTEGSAFDLRQVPLGKLRICETVRYPAVHACTERFPPD